MQLTKNFVKAKNPCTSGYRWFLRDRNGQGDYQEILDALVADNRIDDACWLLDQFGPTDLVLTADCIEADAVVFSGTIKVRRDIHVQSVLRAGRAIHAGAGIRAGGDIAADGSIKAGEGLAAAGLITPGSGHGIYAGLKVRLDAWADAARVVASVRPDALISGYWDEEARCIGLA
jgi:hypothetical protein